MTKLKNLFIELVKIELSNYELISDNIRFNTIKFYAEMIPFNNIPLSEWILICNENQI